MIEFSVYSKGSKFAPDGTFRYVWTDTEPTTADTPAQSHWKTCVGWYILGDDFSWPNVWFGKGKVWIRRDHPFFSPGFHLASVGDKPMETLADQLVFERMVERLTLIKSNAPNTLVRRTVNLR